MRIITRGRIGGRADKSLLGAADPLRKIDRGPTPRGLTTPEKPTLLAHG